MTLYDYSRITIIFLRLVILELAIPNSYSILRRYSGTIQYNSGLLFEYSNNIRIFILSPNWVEITEYHVLGLICTQKFGRRERCVDASAADTSNAQW
jgi:hypothetical protein